MNEEERMYEEKRGTSPKIGMVKMKVKVDYMTLDDFLKLQAFIGKESNLHTISCEGTNLKVSVVGIERGYYSSGVFVLGGMSYHQIGFSGITQVYEGIEIEILRDVLTRNELIELMDLLYQPRNKMGNETK